MNRSSISRRRALQWGASSLLAASALPGRIRAGEGPASEDFTFIAVNDLHYRDDECGKWLERVLAQMKKHDGVELCLVLGDLAEDGTPQQLNAVRDLLKASKMPTHVLIGNHDYAKNDDRA